MYTTNQILFPHTIILRLRSTRGEVFAALVDRVAAAGEESDECLAFMLVMVRLNGCMICETDSFRAMRGCEPCAVQTLRRYKGPDEELLAAFSSALDEIRSYQSRQGRSGTVGAA